MATRPMLTIAILAVALAASTGARAADGPEQRLACQEESRRQITGPRRVDPELYRRVVDRRRLYVQECMGAGPRDIEQTGSISVPLPPKRPIA